ncbi:MAG: hypothetical protein AB2392_08035 [Neobacillus sp.]
MMKIQDFYRSMATVSLNGSIVSLFPAIFIIGGNLVFFQNQQIMTLSIPFLIISWIGFQTYVYRMNQAAQIGRNTSNSESVYRSIFETGELLVLLMNTQSASVLFYCPDGNEAGRIKQIRKGFHLFRLTRIYALYNSVGQVEGFFKVKRGNAIIKIEVYSHDNQYLGCYIKKKITWKNTIEELFDAKNNSLGMIEGSRYFMDEKLVSPSREEVGRLRRGWMPVEWSARFPEPNTPVLSFHKTLSNQDKLVSISLLINEFYIER